MKKITDELIDTLPEHLKEAYFLILKYIDCYNELGNLDIKEKEVLTNKIKPLLELSRILKESKDMSLEETEINAFIDEIRIKLKMLLEQQKINKKNLFDILIEFNNLANLVVSINGKSKNDGKIIPFVKKNKD